MVAHVQVLRGDRIGCLRGGHGTEDAESCVHHRVNDLISQAHHRLSRRAWLSIILPTPHWKPWCAHSPPRCSTAKQNGCIFRQRVLEY